MSLLSLRRNSALIAHIVELQFVFYSNIGHWKAQNYAVSKAMKLEPRLKKELVVHKCDHIGKTFVCRINHGAPWILNYMYQQSPT